MPWVSANLATVLSDATAKASAAITDAQKSLTNLNAQVNSVGSALTAANSALNGNKSLLDTMMESGLYMIPLTPQLGAWNTRLAMAPNEPPNAGYSMGIATIILSANPAALESSYDKMKAALKKPVDDAESFIAATDFSDFELELPELPEIPDLEAPDWEDAFTADAWSAAKLGDVFGGAASGLSKASKDLGNKVKSALSAKNQLNKAASGLNRGLAQANAFVADLNATGTYNVILAPGAGGYLTRLQNEAGAPPSDSQMYSAGFVCVAVAASAEALASKYAAINKIVKGV